MLTYNVQLGIVAAEICRLNPTGAAGSAQVVVMGSVGEGVLAGVRQLGFSVERLAVKNMFEAAALVAKKGYPETATLFPRSFYVWISDRLGQPD